MIILDKYFNVLCVLVINKLPQIGLINHCIKTMLNIVINFVTQNQLRYTNIDHNKRI